MSPVSRPNPSAPHLLFTKMHGLGNDFIVIDGLLASPRALAAQKKRLTPGEARRLCDRHFGVGADQILWIKPARSKKAIAAMEVLNADGSRAEMCGNGIRAVAFYLDKRLPRKKRKPPYMIETGAGILAVDILPQKGRKGERLARVEMGIPEVGQPEKLLAAGAHVEFIPVDMGNPHAVIFVSDPWTYPIDAQGPAIERDPRFPKRTNVEFVQIESSHRAIVRVWERGAGLTLACGTGACASAVAAIASGRAKTPVEVRLPGGSLQIEWAGPGQPVLMSGPAEEVFEGEWL